MRFLAIACAALVLVLCSSTIAESDVSLLGKATLWAALIAMSAGNACFILHMGAVAGVKQGPTANRLKGYWLQLCFAAFLILVSGYLAGFFEA